MVIAFAASFSILVFVSHVRLLFVTSPRCHFEDIVALSSELFVQSRTIKTD